MKVLYILSNYPQSSESYIDAEIAYVRSRGVEVAVWSDVVGYGREIPFVRVFRQSLTEALGVFQPDLVHIHYLVKAQDTLRVWAPLRPITVRAHSFDWSVDRAAWVSSVPQVNAIYAFPHFAREAAHLKKVVPMPVAYDAALYDAPVNNGGVIQNRVVRLAAGRRMKGLNDFMAVARRVPASYVLAVSRIRGDEQYITSLLKEGRESGVEVCLDSDRPTAVQLTRTAAVYLDTSDPLGHAFGMPISIAEALACGAVVIVRDCPAAREYAGEAAFYYKSVEEAAILVDRALKLYDPNLATTELGEISERARERARLFRSDVVLPRLVDDWERIVSGRFA